MTEVTILYRTIHVYDSMDNTLVTVEYINYIT